MTTVKSKSKSKPDLKGFQEKNLDLPQAWEFEEQGEWILGDVVEFRELTTKDRKGNPRDTRVMILNTSEGTRAVWETAQLTELFNSLNKGDSVYIEFEGKRTLDNGNTLNHFTCQVKHG